MSAFVFILLALLLLECGHGCEEGDVRLVGGYHNSSGRVEFCHGGEWGTVCDDGWGSDEARVVCRQLGLPTDVAPTISSFGHGSGAIFLSDVECSGLEERLKHCNHSGIGFHNCKHFEDVGVICGELERGDKGRCGFGDFEPELQSDVLERFGNCVPFKIHARGTPCDKLYTPGVDHVYIPYRRNGGDFEEYLDIVEDFTGLVFNIIPDKCHDHAKQVFCHHFFPSCGNSTVFEPPKSVCMEICNYLHEICPSAWKQVMAYFEENDFWLRPRGLTFINCSNTGEYLDPLPYCCSDVGVDILCTKLDGSGKLVRGRACFSSTQPNLAHPSSTVSPNASQQTSGSVAITVGSVCSAVAVLLLVVICGAMWILIRKHRQRRKQKTSEPWTPAKTKPLQGPKVSIHYNVTGNLLEPPAVPPRAVSNFDSGCGHLTMTITDVDGDRQEQVHNLD